MKKTVLIAGKSSELLEEFTREYLKAGYLVAASLDESRSSLAEYTEPGAGSADNGNNPQKKSAAAGSKPSEDGEKQINPVFVYDLNRRSPLSARTFILRTITRFGGIDEAIVLNTAEGENRPLHELPAAAIEGPVDNAVKGPFFILRELLNYFWEQRKGLLSLASWSYGPEVLTPMDAAAAGSFKALGDSLFTYYANEPITVNGFESQSSRYTEFARFLMQTNRERGPKSHGRWFRHSDRGGLLSGLPFSGPKK